MIFKMRYSSLFIALWATSCASAESGLTENCQKEEVCVLVRENGNKISLCFKEQHEQCCSGSMDEWNWRSYFWI